MSKYHIDWVNLHAEIMREAKGKHLLKHIYLWTITFAVGIIIGLLMFQNVGLVLALGGIALPLDYLLYGDELYNLITMEKPYLIEGKLLQRIQKISIDEKTEEEFENFYFEIEVVHAVGFDKDGLDALELTDKHGKIRLEVQESMFLSLQKDDEISVVCTPDEIVWGWVRDDEVIVIEK
ncbi:MAG: hypothetical protein EAZ85_01205 [Bacteroidetes bacterium]|nr:MAG: hypothetical protein EAZ85_01205 [Bacteroidota bacterium]TAG90419.1 MAG: hypothetical protein EAZ20_04295 [Bacteroidota bacterium]